MILIHYLEQSSLDSLAILQINLFEKFQQNFRDDLLEKLAQLILHQKSTEGQTSN